VSNDERTPEDRTIDILADTIIVLAAELTALVIARQARQRAAADTTPKPGVVSGVTA